MKNCRKCLADKPLTDFAVNRATPDGRHRICKLCDAAKARAWHHRNKPRVAARKLVWREANREHVLAKDRARYTADPIGISAKRREYYRKNKTKVVARVMAYNAARPDDARRRVREWSYRNPTKLRKYSATRRAIKMQAQPTWLSAVQLAQIQEFYDIAEARTVQTGETHHVDHIEPLRGKTSRGLHVPWNLQVLTAFDNLSKGNRMSPAVAATPTRG